MLTVRQGDPRAILPTVKQWHTSEGSCTQERHNRLLIQLSMNVITPQAYLIVVDKVTSFIHEKVMCWLRFWDIKKLQTLLEKQQQILKKHLPRSYYEPNSKMKDKNAIKTRKFLIRNIYIYLYLTLYILYVCIYVYMYYTHIYMNIYRHIAI